MIEHMLHIITHVASQLSYRWLPQPSLFGHDLFSGVYLDTGFESLVNLSRADWRHLVSMEVAGGCRNLSWLAQWFKKRDPDGEQLVNHAYHWVKAVYEVGGNILTLCDPHYPELLKHISDPPLALSMIGSLNNLSSACEAIVGSRQASGFSLRQSYQLGYRLARSGITVVSGGAIGCDIAAHRGVLASTQANVAAVVVFAGGLHELYPRQNQFWFNQIKNRGGSFISERLWGAKCRPVDFRARNRIVSGLSRRIYVMQASLHSGAMITARFALDQGRDVAVLSHSPGDIRAAGGISLLREGAAAILEASEVGSETSCS